MCAERTRATFGHERETFLIRINSTRLIPIDSLEREIQKSGNDGDEKQKNHNGYLGSRSKTPSSIESHEYTAL